MTVPDHATELAEPRRLDADAGLGSIPPANRPGHHPETEQDKPSPARLRRASSRSRASGTRRFPLAFDPLLGVLSRGVGAHPGRAWVELSDEGLRIQYGPWSLQTELDNVESATVTGPYRWWKVGGVPRLSLADRGLTFAASADRGVCIRFREPVPAALPVSILRHPAVTVTVADPEGLVAALDHHAEPASEPADQAG